MTRFSNVDQLLKKLARPARPAQKVGKKYLIRHEDLAAWISREGEPT